MTEEKLKQHYASFARALAMLQQPEKTTRETAAACIRQAGGGVLSRLFCLAAWREVKRLKEGNPSLPGGQYKEAVTDAWRLFKANIGGDGSDAYWDRLVEGLGDILGRYGHCQFITDLCVYVVLEAIEEAQYGEREQRLPSRTGEPDKKEEKVIRKFEVGKEYTGRNGHTYTCTKRSEKSVWFNGNRYELKTDMEGNEHTTTVVRIPDIRA